MIETRLEKTKCVILYDKAYTQRLNADGLALSVPRGAKDHIPISTRDLLDEYTDDVGNYPKYASLSRWAQNGVFLWNVIAARSDRTLTRGTDVGWVLLAKEILETAYLYDEKIVFVLWDPLPAILVKGVLPKEALVIRTPGPGFTGFWGSRPFSEVNRLRKTVDASPVNWRLK
jgi:uracil-DNA glycosylase